MLSSLNDQEQTNSHLCDLLNYADWKFIAPVNFWTFHTFPHLLTLFLYELVQAKKVYCRVTNV